MTTDLFIQKPVLKFAAEKRAAVQLDEDPESWPRQILVELFRSAPETSDYTPTVAMMKVDEEQGFGIGVVVIENTTDSALAVSRMSSTAQRVLVPVVIRNHMLDPLDLLITKSGKMMPLNSGRLREALFRPDTFDQITDDWGDTTLYNAFYPPGRSDNDFGAGISQGIGGGTQGAVTFIQGPGMKLSFDEFSSKLKSILTKVSGTKDYAMLRAVAPTVLSTDIDKVASIAEAEPAILRGGTRAAVDGLVLIAGMEKMATRSAAPLMVQALDVAPTTVVQLGYDDAAGTYWVKRASRHAYRGPVLYELTRREILKLAGEEVVRKVDGEGTITISADPNQDTTDEVEASKWKNVEEPGIYTVKTVHGKEMTGWVIPNLVDLDGDRVPMCVFTNGAAAMVQSTVVGVRVSSGGVDLPHAPPKGTGCFYAGSGGGGVVATVPLLIQGRKDDGSYLVRSLTGEESMVRIVPGLLKMQVLKGEFHLPESAKFLPLDKEAMVALVDSSNMKTAADFTAPMITLFGADDETVSVRFQAMPKLAAATQHRITHDDAVFLLCLAGTTAKTAHTKLAEALTGHTVNVRGLIDAALASDIINHTRKTASDRSHEVTQLKRTLVKEAAVLPDVMTVDAVLSLGFINSENVRMYASRTPYLEKCLSMVCELLLGARIGLTEIPEFAAARCARALDETIQGLKALALRDVREGASQGT